MWVSFLGFVFDLNFADSARQILEAGYWKKPLADMLEQNRIEDQQVRNQVEELLEKTEESLIRKKNDSSPIE